MTTNDHITLDPDEVNTVKNLISDWGFEYALRADRDRVIALAEKLNMSREAKDLRI